MKKLTRTMKCVVMLLSLCLLMGISTVVEAAKAAEYQPGKVYVNPAISSYKNKEEYYSLKKMRMSTYSDTTFEVVYPKDATLEVKSKKKALKATIVEQDNATINDTKSEEKVYVNATVEEYRYYYKNYAKDISKVLTPEPATGRYFYTETHTIANANISFVGKELLYEKTESRYDWYTDSYISYSHPVYVDKYYISDLNLYVLIDPRDYNVYYYDSTSGSWKTNDSIITWFNYNEYSKKHNYSYDETVYATPNYIVPSKASYTDPATGVVYTMDSWENELCYDSAREAFYYYTKLEGVHYDNTQYQTYEDSTAKYEYATATVKLTSTKAGTYKVNVLVNGQKTTITIFVSPYTSAYKKATLDGKTIYSHTIKKTSKNDNYTTTENYNVKKNLESAKLKFTANKGFKITGIVSAYLNTDGKAVYKKGKNGSKIKLSKAYEYDNRYDTHGSKYRSTVKNTYVFVSWKDTKLKTSCTYSVIKKNGTKMIKCVEKKSDGKKYTSFIEYDTVWDAPSCITLWSY